VVGSAGCGHGHPADENDHEAEQLLGRHDTQPGIIAKARNGMGTFKND
jgi:hypothetical protein